MSSRPKKQYESSSEEVVRDCDPDLIWKSSNRHSAFGVQLQLTARSLQPRSVMPSRAQQIRCKQSPRLYTLSWTKRPEDNSKGSMTNCKTSTVNFARLPDWTTIRKSNC